jgi:hypothetical protein
MNNKFALSILFSVIKKRKKIIIKRNIYLLIFQNFLLQNFLFNCLKIIKKIAYFYFRKINLKNKNLLILIKNRFLIIIFFAKFI